MNLQHATAIVREGDIDRMPHAERMHVLAWQQQPREMVRLSEQEPLEPFLRTGQQLYRLN